MPSPRQIALATNQSTNFDKTVESSYDAVAGTPIGVAPQGNPDNYAVNPVNPPEQAAPAKNLKR